LFTSFYPYLFAFARTLVRAKETAEEVVSDVFIRIWERRKELDKVENLKVYLYVSTRNTAFNYLEKTKTQRHQLHRRLPRRIHQRLFRSEQLLITADMLALIQKSHRRPPSQMQNNIQTGKEDGLKYRDVAEILNISVKTVENQLAIALHKIGTAVSFDIKKTISFPLGHHR